MLFEWPPSLSNKPKKRSLCALISGPVNWSEATTKLQKAKELLSEDLDDHIKKLQEVEMARDYTLKGKVEAAEELKWIFTTNKAVLEQTKANDKSNLARITEIYNHNLKQGRKLWDP